MKKKKKVKKKKLKVFPNPSKIAWLFRLFLSSLSWGSGEYLYILSISAYPNSTTTVMKNNLLINIIKWCLISDMLQIWKLRKLISKI